MLGKILASSAPILTVTILVFDSLLKIKAHFCSNLLSVKVLTMSFLL